MRVVVIISGGGSNLQAFIDAIDSSQLDCEICLVISNQATAYGLERADSAGIDTRVIDHTDYNSRVDFDKSLSEAIDEAQADLIVLAGFMRILTPEFVGKYSNKLLNIHPSLLPKYPGNNTHQRVLDAKEVWHGASVHYVVAEVDAGPVIIQGRLKVNASDTANTLQERIHVIEHQIYPQAVQWICQNRLEISNGKVLLDGEVSDRQLQTFNV